MIPNLVCKDEAHWSRNQTRPMSFVFTFSGIPYLDTLGIHANWIDYRWKRREQEKEEKSRVFIRSYKTSLSVISLNIVSIVHYSDTANHERLFLELESIRPMIGCVVVDDTDDVQLNDRKRLV